MADNETELQQRQNPHMKLVENRSQNRNGNHFQNNNNHNDQNIEQVTFTQTIKKYMTPKNIQKLISIILLFAIALWIGTTFFSAQALNKRQPPRISSSDAVEMAAPDELSLRSYFFYRHFVQLAKNKTKDPDSVPQTFSDDFDNMTFWQIFELFKVLRAVQYANSWKGVDNDDQNDNKTDEQQNVPDVKSVNLTKYFEHLPIQDQGGCASCYAFPITATIQYIYKAKYNISIKLSQQQIIDCARRQKDKDKDINGCQDGNMTRGFQYVMEQGLVSLDDYPYRSMNGQSNQCKVPENAKRYKISGFKALKSSNACNDIINALKNNVSVASMINAARLSFWDEQEAFGDCRRDKPNHAITLMGLYQNLDYYARNSWGLGWGWQGYFKLKRGNTCGICKHRSIAPYLHLQNGTPESVTKVQEVPDFDKFFDKNLE